jgi:hypothetical protein
MSLVAAATCLSGAVLLMFATWYVAKNGNSLMVFVFLMWILLGCLMMFIFGQGCAY